MSKSHYPKSWIHLNEQLFCPIRYSQSLYATQNIISNAGERLLKYIYDTQFISNCDDPNHKYIIFDISQTRGTGIGASFNGGILKYFARAIMSKRTFLINGKFEWTESNKDCDKYIGMECYFLPLSNCDPTDILKKTNKSDIWMGSVPQNCTLGDESTVNKLNGVDNELFIPIKNHQDGIKKIILMNGFILILNIKIIVYLVILCNLKLFYNHLYFD